jgi:RND family efflux transporter MFP subunit
MAADLETVPAKYDVLPELFVVDGLVEAVNEATLSAQTSGQVLEINFDVEDFVEKGKVLVKLNDEQQRSAVNEANAQLRQAQAHLSGVQSEYNRIKKSYDRQAVSAAEMDRVSASLRTAQAQVNAAEAGVRRAQEQLSYTVMKAPYSGLVVERHIEPGEIANPGQLIMTGISLEELRVVTSIPQNQVNAIKTHKEAYVLLDKLDDSNRLNAEKITISPKADGMGHTFQVRLVLPANITDLYPGMFVKVVFDVGESKRLMVPVSAVANRGTVRAVYVLNEAGQVSMRQVRLGKKIAEQVEILAGLEVGEQVALNPLAATVMLKQQRSQAAVEDAANAH